MSYSSKWSRLSFEPKSWWWLIAIKSESERATKNQSRERRKSTLLQKFDTYYVCFLYWFAEMLDISFSLVVSLVGFLSEYLMFDVYYRLGDMSSAIYGHRVKCDVDSQFMIISKKFISTRFRNEFTISIGHSIKCNDQNLLFISNSRGNYFDLIQLRLSAFWFHRQVIIWMLSGRCAKIEEGKNIKVKFT